MKRLKKPMLLLLMVIPKIEGHIEINATLNMVGFAQQSYLITSDYRASPPA